MAELSETKKGFSIICDCGLVHTVEKDEEGIFIETSYKKKKELKKEVIEKNPITEKPIEKEETKIITSLWGK